MNSPTIALTPIAPRIGVVLDGLDLAQVLDDSTFLAIRDAVDDHHVVVVRGQNLTPEQHRAVAERFGDLVAAPVHRLKGQPATVSTIEDTAERPPAGFPWHTDLSWTAEPPAFGFLSAVTIPPVGGDTQWVSTAALYERLTPVERTWCNEAYAVHAPDASLMASVELHHGAELASRLRADYPPIEHPLVRLHPRTGRPSLYLSPLYVRRLSGPTGVDKAALLERLHNMLEDQSLQMRWQWRDGDFLIWDESSTVHRALTDHYPHHRVMRRCATSG